MGEPMNLRRLRQSEIVRGLVSDVQVDAKKLMQPLFCVEALKEKQAIPGLTDVYRDTEETILRQIESDLEAGVKSFLLFGVPAHRSKQDFHSDFTARAISQIKKRFGADLLLAVDVCLCSYTEHGQCGVLNPEGDHVENATTVSELAKFAVSYAQAGADCVAPSDMMDGRVRAIRNGLAAARLEKTLLMSYAVKFHSSFYGPFRVAADSAPKGKVLLKDRATYQIDFRNSKDAVRSALRDQEEGADILMVKPGLPYLDVLSTLSRDIHLPWAVYEVSGEYAAIELLAREGLANGPRAHVESWTAFVRSGAQIVITYGARNAKEWLKNG